MKALRSFRPSGTTWALLAAAVASATWAHVDAGRDEAPRATLVSTRSAAWRVLPELSTLASAGATVELWPGHGEPVRLVPGGVGHQLWRGDEVLGPADPEAVEGIWDSLRMATTVRAADAASDAGIGDGGRIVVELPGELGVRTLMLGRPAVDGSGVYGVVEGGAEGTEGLWVLEPEMATLVQQAAEAWLARRLVVAEPVELLAVNEGSLRVERGLDGLWRAQLGQDSSAIFDRVAVKTRLERLVSARLDPLVDPVEGDAGQPWITLEGDQGVDWALRQHGPCPGRPDRTLVSRGVGRWGCIDAALVAPWPAPGREVEQPGALVDPRLWPHAYGRVLRIEQRRPQARTLQRYGGGWRIEEQLDGREALLSVDEAEVRRWYGAVHDAEVTLDPEPPPWPAEADVDLRLTTDSTATLRVQCLLGSPLRCRRDDGPVLQVLGSAPALSFDADTFAERRLTALRSEDIRALEVLPGPADPAVVRQSAQLDLGVWRLDAPTHPEGDAALDGTRLEGLLATLSGLRADAWVDDAAEVGALRRLRIEQVPRRGQDPVIEVELLPECVVRVPGHRPARLSPGSCETLGQDLLVDWPLQRPLDLARSLELTTEGQTTRLQRRGDAWARPDGGPAPDANTWLGRMHERTAAAIRRASPPDPVQWQLRVLPSRGTAFVFEGSDRWARLQGVDWYYVLSADEFDAEIGDDEIEDDVPEPVAPEDKTPDPDTPDTGTL